MCFSATASFSASAGLAALGAWSMARARRKARALAAVPWLFSVQQACEGATWLALSRAPFQVAHTLAGQAFLFFALLVWPGYLPAAVALHEARRGPRRALWATAAVGVGLGGYLFGCATLRDANVCVAYGNLYYWIQTPHKHALLGAYAAVITVPFALASARGAKLVGALLLASFAAAALLTRAGFLSVWCFFAAVVSGALALLAGVSRPASR